MNTRYVEYLGRLYYIIDEDADTFKLKARFTGQEIKVSKNNSDIFILPDGAVDTDYEDLMYDLLLEQNEQH